MPDAPIVVPNIPALPTMLAAAPDRYSAPAPKVVDAVAINPPIAAVLKYVPATYPLALVTINPPAACGTRCPLAAMAEIIGINGSGILGSCEIYEFTIFWT
jgi:hypothetical protein